MHRSRLTLEMKYGLFGVLIVSALLVVGRTEVVSQAGNDVVSAMDSLAAFGLLGMFVVALVANVSLFIQIPYTLPLLSAAIGGASAARMMSLGVAAGLGAALGALASYQIAAAVLSRRPDLPRSSLFQWVARHVESHPRKTAGAVLVVFVTPLPDDAAIVPLATVKYGLRRMVPLAFVGKLAHNLLVALVFSGFALWAKDHISRSASVNVALGAMVLFVLVIFYQAEKARERADQQLATNPSRASA